MSEPCAKLTMRVTPKISVSPRATRNSSDALASPLSVWIRNEEIISQAPGDEGGNVSPEA